MRALFLSLLLLLPNLSWAEEEKNPDPWEGFNRTMFSFNSKADKYVFRPLAVGYKTVTPQPVRSSVTNFFSNLNDLVVIVNDVAQLKLGQAASDSARFLINTTVGFFGFFDVASHIGLPKHDEDFGQTLGYWGVGSGPYLVLPLLGPSTPRDFGGILIGYEVGLSYLDMGASAEEGYLLTLAYAVNLRASFLDAEGLISGDQYTFMRSYYLQRREFLINDGKSVDDFGDDSWEEWDEDD